MPNIKLENTNRIEITVGIVRPISPVGTYTFEHWNNIQKVIEGALSSDEQYDFKVSLVSDGDKAEVIQNTIIRNLYHSDVVVCDLSSQNPNVFFELGVRMTFRKPCILIVDSNTKAPFDVSSIKYLKYPKTLHKYELERELEIPLRKMVIASYEQYKSDKKVAFEALFTEIMLNSDELGLDTKQASKIDLIYEILTSKEEAEILYHQNFQYFRQRGIDRMREYIDENIENLVENMSSEQEIREELYGVLKQLRREENKLYPPIPIASIEREIQELIDDVQKKQNIFRLKNYELVK